MKQQIRSKITTISALQVFSSELISPLVSFSRMFSGTPESVCYSFLFDWNVSSNNLLSLFLCFFKKIRRPVVRTTLFSKYSWMAASWGQLQRYIYFRNSNGYTDFIFLWGHVKKNEFLWTVLVKVSAKSVSTQN